MAKKERGRQSSSCYKLPPRILCVNPLSFLKDFPLRFRARKASLILAALLLSCYYYFMYIFPDYFLGAAS